MSGSIKHIIALIIVLAIAAGAYFVLQDGALLKGHHRRAEEIESETEQLKKDIILPLTRLQGVSIDSAFFEDTGYKALEDKSVVLTTPETERTNPFAPAR